MSDFSSVQTAALEEFKADIGHLNALANANRQKLIMILGQNPDERGMKVNDLAQTIGLSQPATSHHLKQLRDIGMVGSRQEGNVVYYYLTLDDTIARMERMVKALKQRACQK